MSERILDASGIYGGYLHYATVIFFVGTAFIAFLYLWQQGRLDMDEDPKFEMMKNDEDKNE